MSIVYFVLACLCFLTAHASAESQPLGKATVLSALWTILFLGAWLVSWCEAQLRGELE